MKVLHVMNDFPYPPTHGARVDIWGRVLALASLGFEVDAVVTLKERPSEDDISHLRRLVHNLHLVDRRPNWAGVFSSLPIQVSSRIGLRDIQLKGSYDLALGESEFSFPIFENKRLIAHKKVLRIHNNESRFMLELKEIDPSVFNRMYYREESKRLLSFSPEAFASVDQLWFSSAAQFEDFSRSHPGDVGKAAWLPPPVDTMSFHKPVAKSSKQVLFVGGLSVQSNIEAIQWYMLGVHPRLKSIEGYRFVIAGSTRGLPLSPVIERAASDQRCAVYTDLPELSSLYQESAVFVNCMVHGASIKMKTVNAAEKGVPIVSTSVGNEGTGFVDGDHILIADSHEPFVCSIEHLFEYPQTGKEMAERAQNFLRYRYHHAEQIASLLKKDLPGSGRE